MGIYILDKCLIKVIPAGYDHHGISEEGLNYSIDLHNIEINADPEIHNTQSGHFAPTSLVMILPFDASLIATISYLYILGRSGGF